MLARVINMRGVDLTRFDFDYDLTWAGFFLNAQDHVYGRYGGRDPSAADAHLTLTGLKYAMRRALEAYQKNPDARAVPATPLANRPELFEEGRRMKADACIHCHQVYDFSRTAMRQAGQWRKEMAWIYPPPETLGFSVDPNQGDRITAVKTGSPAAGARLRPGDLLRTVGGKPVASFADLIYALHYSPETGQIPVSVERAGGTQQLLLRAAPGWRVSDISWRASMWRLEPAASVYGEDLSRVEKEKLGLEPDALAFRQGRFVPKPAAPAGIRANDIILGIEGKPFKGTMLQFNVWVRMNFNPGDRIVYQVIRGTERLKIPMTLTARDSF